MPLLLVTLAAVLWFIWITGLLVFGRRAELRIGAPRDFIFPMAALLVVLAWLLSAPSSALFGFLSLDLHTGLVVAAWMVLVWLLSLVACDASITDITNPLMASLSVAVLIGLRGVWSEHEIVTLALAGLWSVRLATHIGMRNLGHGEDNRYAAWRTQLGKQWWLSLFQAFTMHGVPVWLWSLGLIMAVAAGPAAIGWQHVLALLLFAVGFIFQAGSDLQLERFRKKVAACYALRASEKPKPGYRNRTA